jgi:hypothetical protein
MNDDDIKTLPQVRAFLDGTRVSPLPRRLWCAHRSRRKGLLRHRQTEPEAD